MLFPHWAGSVSCPYLIFHDRLLKSRSNHGLCPLPLAPAPCRRPVRCLLYTLVFTLCRSLHQCRISASHRHSREVLGAGYGRVALFRVGVVCGDWVVWRCAVLADSDCPATERGHKPASASLQHCGDIVECSMAGRSGSFDEVGDADGAKQMVSASDVADWTWRKHQHGYTTTRHSPALSTTSPASCTCYASHETILRLRYM